ncbi:MAG: bifunctional 23S rRNA (guanine(2069)-N(7))-methyltransferase RlmK/23S rRNA (guanine(2445)-N(2))-methyltransferase RlmL [Gammaproteobacteria bacterium]|nr:bifunctional 23S rRNA (guanine(2069)-N(7))-methyltransferase RlmK/23S rRNA (guanine(2445)-N(2))-methyltransferase RlmL [Gammaproteobacteria bacterium]
MSEQFEFFATSSRDLETLVADELNTLGISDCKTSPGSVRFKATLEQAYRACLWSRLANRILMPLANFAADNEKALYDGVNAIDWLSHFDHTCTLAIDANVSRSKFNNSHFVALQVKDAIVDQMRDRCGERPNIDIKEADIRVNVYIHRDQVQIALDLSGGSLHQRGYRIHGGSAPLKENLAAAILVRAGWPAIAKSGGAFCDFMCGSGTLLIEAALMAGDVAPGLQKKRFGFQFWKRFDTSVWEKLLHEAEERRDVGLQQIPRIIGFDQSYKAYLAAQDNIENAGLGAYIHLEKQELEQINVNKKIKEGLVCINPPYGVRIGELENLGSLYRAIGRQLRSQFVNWKAGIFTANPDLGKMLDIHANKQYSFYNGPLKCKLLLMDINPTNFITPRRLPKLLDASQFSENAQMLRNRLVKNQKHLAKWLRQHNISCYRLYDADIPEYAMAIDIYESDKLRIHVQEYEAPKTIDEQAARQRVREALSVVREEFGISEDELFFKRRRQQKGTQQYEKQSQDSPFYTVSENNHRFLVNLEDFLDTGLFLDHRLARSWVEENSANADFLNLFAYTGSATVYAAAGGARSTTTVDMSRTYLDWAIRNFQLNGFELSDSHQFIQADCIDWLKKQAPYPVYDLIFLDPPSFSNSKRMKDVLDIQRDHVELIKNCMRLLRPKGLLIFSNNLRNFKLDSDALSAYSTKNMTRPSIPKDFERDQKIHHCWFITHASG